MQVPTLNMQKSSEFESPIIELIKNRRSRRAYADKPIEQEKIESLFEAARWAPSSVNEQPWAYIYATREQQTELWNKIFDSLTDNNKVWVKNVPLLIASLAKRNFSRNDKPNSAARYDLGAANAFLSLQATQLGLNVHQMGGFFVDKLSANLNIPDTYEPVIVLAIGYPGEIATLPDHLQQRELAPRERFRQQEFVMNKIF